jgi:hypothetical protein
LVLSKPGKNKESIIEEISTKHLAEEFDRLLQLLTQAWLLRVEYDCEAVYISDLFQAINHENDVLCISIVGVTEPWIVDGDEKIFSRLVLPSGKHNIELACL